MRVEFWVERKEGSLDNIKWNLINKFKNEIDAVLALNEQDDLNEQYELNITEYYQIRKIYVL